MSPSRLKKNADDGLIDFPVTVVIDSREQRAFDFSGIKADADQGGKIFRVKTVVEGLRSGDYSLEGFENKVAVERKSIGDLFGTLSQDRARFERELCRLACYDFSAVVVEADWRAVLTDPPARSQLNPKTIIRSVIAWQQRYACTHWWFCPDRRFAEVLTLRILERYWKDQVSGRMSSGSGFALWRARKLAEQELAEAGLLDEDDKTTGED